MSAHTQERLFQLKMEPPLAFHSDETSYYLVDANDFTHDWRGIILNLEVNLKSFLSYNVELLIGNGLP